MPPYDLGFLIYAIYPIRGFKVELTDINEYCPDVTSKLIPAQRVLLLHSFVAVIKSV